MRSRRRIFTVIALALAAAIGFVQPVYAYADPATASSIILPILAPILAIFLGAIAFFVRPVRRFFGSIARRLLRSPREEPAETADKAESYFQLDDTGNEKEANPTDAESKS